MKGLLYKELYLLKNGLIFTAAFQAIMTGICISLSMIGSDSTLTIIVITACYYLSFLILSLVNQEIFTHDEKRPWNDFVSSTPQTARGQIAGKYYMILIENLVLLFCCYLTDIFVVCIADNVLVSTIAAGMIIFCLRIIAYAIEIPFIIRFGSNVGAAVKGALLAFLMLILLCYGLFGDISFLFGDDPAAAFIAFINSENVIWIIVLIPYIAVCAYYLSYCISVKLYEEADCYE